MKDNALLSRTEVDQNVRSVAFNHDGTHLAVGMGDGSFTVLKTK